MSGVVRRSAKSAMRGVNHVLYSLITLVPYFRFVPETRKSQTPITLKIWFWQKILGFNRGAYWPMHFSSKVSGATNVYAGIDVSPGYEPGCYIQAMGPVLIGDYTQIASNVGIISSNHDPHDLRRHVSDSVTIGGYCWIGMNAVVLPGVTLGDFTVVGAGSVVTHSFPEGYCVIAGNPARLIKALEKSECVRHRNELEYFGYVPATKFAAFRAKRLRV